MIIWLFYIYINSNKHSIAEFMAMDDNDVEYDGKYCKSLYAFTNDKKLYREFKLFRDMSLFKIQRIDSCNSKELWNELESNRPELELGIYNFNTMRIRNNITISDYVRVCCTEREFSLTDNVAEIDVSDIICNFIEISSNNKADSIENLSKWLDDFLSIFNNRIRSALETIDFKYIIMSYMGSERILDYCNSQYCEDMLEIFCSIFCNTFNKDMIEERRFVNE